MVATSNLKRAKGYATNSVLDQEPSNTMVISPSQNETHLNSLREAGPKPGVTAATSTANRDYYIGS